MVLVFVKIQKYLTNKGLAIKSTAAPTGGGLRVRASS